MCYIKSLQGYILQVDILKTCMSNKQYCWHHQCQYQEIPNLQHISWSCIISQTQLCIKPKIQPYGNSKNSKTLIRLGIRICRVYSCYRTHSNADKQSHEDITCYGHHLTLSNSFQHHLIISDRKCVQPTVLWFYHAGSPCHCLVVTKTQDHETPLKFYQSSSHFWAHWPTSASEPVRMSHKTTLA